MNRLFIDEHDVQWTTEKLIAVHDNGQKNVGKILFSISYCQTLKAIVLNLVFTLKTMVINWSRAVCFKTLLEHGL